MKTNYRKKSCIVILLTLLLMSSVYALFIPNVYAQQSGLQQQGEQSAFGAN